MYLSNMAEPGARTSRPGGHGSGDLGGMGTGSGGGIGSGRVMGMALVKAETMGAASTTSVAGLRHRS